MPAGARVAAGSLPDRDRSVVLPAAVRMRASAEFSHTVRHGARCAVGPIVVHLDLPPAAAVEDPAPIHVGLVVSRAVGNAVVRHRVSRRLRHLLVHRITSLPPGSRLVVRALPMAAGADSAALGAALDRAVTRVTNRRSTAPAAAGGGHR